MYVYSATKNLGFIFVLNKKISHLELSDFLIKSWKFLH